MLPDKEALDFSLEEYGNVVSNISYKGASEFTAVTAGTFKLELRDHATHELKANLNTNMRRAGKYITPSSPEVCKMQMTTTNSFFLALLCFGFLS